MNRYAVPQPLPKPARQQTSQEQRKRSARLALEVEPLEMEDLAALLQPQEVQRRARRSRQPPRPREIVAMRPCRRCGERREGDERESSAMGPPLLWSQVRTSETCDPDDLPSLRILTISLARILCSSVLG